MRSTNDLVRGAPVVLVPVALSLCLAALAACSVHRSRVEAAPVPARDPETATQPDVPVSGRHATERAVAAPTAGPLASLEELCRAFAASIASEQRHPSQSTACAENDMLPDQPSVTSEGPLEAARLVSLPVEYATECAVAIQFGSRWFLDRLGTCKVQGSGQDYTEISELAIETLGADRGPRLLFRTTVISLHASDGGFVSDWGHICGVGPSTVPSCLSFHSAFRHYPSVEDQGGVPAGYAGEGTPDVRVVADLSFKVGDRLITSFRDEERVGTAGEGVRFPGPGETLLVFP